MATLADAGDRGLGEQPGDARGEGLLSLSGAAGTGAGGAGKVRATPGAPTRWRCTACTAATKLGVPECTA